MIEEDRLISSNVHTNEEAQDPAIHPIQLFGHWIYLFNAAQPLYKFIP